MASFMPTACCAAGYQHDGTPTGDVTAFEDLEIYTAKPSVAEPKKAILYLSDIYGFPVVNHKLLSDNFAKQGYLTIYPNLFGDDPAPWPRTDEFDFPAWREVHNIEVTEAIINKAIAYTKKEFPSVVQFFAVGYCFGGKYVVRLLDQAKIDAGFVAHPTFVTDEELRAIQGPLSIAAAGKINFIWIIARGNENFILIARIPQRSTISCLKRNAILQNESSRKSVLLIF